MTKPLVSVLVPVYNVEKYLARCLDSILRQSLSEIEVICINDGSTDSSLTILEKYRAEDERIKIFSKKNGGLPSARNAGIEVAKGKYISFIDSDDFIDVDMMRILYSRAEKDRADLVVCGISIFPQENKVDQWTHYTMSPEEKQYRSRDPRIFFYDDTIKPYLVRVFVKRELIHDHNLRLSEKVHLGEDMAFQAKLYMLAKVISVIPNKLYHYMLGRENSIMQDMRLENPEIGAIKHIDLIEDIYHTIETFILRGEKRSQEHREILVLYLNWAIDFLYVGFTYFSHENKVKYADRILTGFEKAEYHSNKFELKLETRAMFDYINQFRKEKGVTPKISIVCILEENIEYFESMYSSLLNQTEKNFELILVNRQIREDYNRIANHMQNDQRIRLINVVEKRCDEAMNIGISLVASPYLTFISSCDWYNLESSLEKMIEKMEEGYEICASTFSMRGSSSEYVDHVETMLSKLGTLEKTLKSDFQNVIFRVDFVQRNKLRFKDKSLFMGFDFLVRACLKAKTIGWLDEVLYVHREVFQSDWIPTEKCEKILATANELIELAVEKELYFLQYLLVDKINNDKLKKMLVNNTLPWKGDPEIWKDGINSQVKTILLLMRFCEKVSPDIINKYSKNLNYLDTLFEVIEKRNDFLK